MRRARLLSGSAWKEYRRTARSPARRCPPGLEESARFDPPIFSPATKAEVGHDENITIARMAAIDRRGRGGRARRLSLLVYERGRAIAAERGIIIADTKFEFGRDRRGARHADRRSAHARQLALLARRSLCSRAARSRASTSSRCAIISTPNAAPAAGTAKHRHRRCRTKSSHATSARYLDAFRRITGHTLD